MKPHLLLALASGCVISGENLPNSAEGPDYDACLFGGATPVALNEVAPNGVSPAAALAAAQGTAIHFSFIPYSDDPSLPATLEGSMTMRFEAPLSSRTNFLAYSLGAYYVPESTTYTRATSGAPTGRCPAGLYVPAFWTSTSTDGYAVTDQWIALLVATSPTDVRLMGAHGGFAAPPAAMFDVSNAIAHTPKVPDDTDVMLVSFWTPGFTMASDSSTLPEVGQYASDVWLYDRSLSAPYESLGFVHLVLTGEAALQ